MKYGINGKKAVDLTNVYKFDIIILNLTLGNHVAIQLRLFWNLSRPPLLTKLEDCLKILLKLELNQVKPFINECKKDSTILLQKSIKNKSTQCHFKKQCAINNHMKTLEDYRV